MHRLHVTPENNPISLPHPPAAALTPAGFVLYALAALPGQPADQFVWQQWIYQRAFDAAQAVVRPSLPERDLCGVWN